MKFSLSGLACLSAAVIALVTPAKATNSYFSTGDLLLTFQKAGSSKTVYADLGSAASFRGSSVGTYASNQIDFLDINAVLTRAFGAGWASDPSIFASVAGVYASSGTSNTVVNGDASRTLYVSATRNDVGTVGQSNSGTPTVGSNTDMTSAAASILSQNNVFADVPVAPFLPVGYDAKAVVSDTSISKIDDQQPITVFGGSNIQGTAFGVFGGGIAQAGSASSFGTLGAVSNVEFALDLYRIVAVNGKTNQVNGTLRSGDFQGTVTVNSSGKVSFVAGVAAVTDVIPVFTTQPSPATINSGSTAIFTVEASGTSPTFQWYTGASGDTSNPISGATAASYTTTALTATTSFWVRAHNSAGDADSTAATVTVITAPTFTSQPSSTTINSGSTATLTIAASGTSPTFQWYRGNSGDTSNLISGATAASYTTSALIETTSFWVRASNAAGNADSNTAMVTVTEVVTAPVITTQPSPTTINSGSTATFTVAASGTSPTYQWYRGNSGDTANPISGATASSYTSTALTATTSFWVRAHNSAGDADSNAATATVITALAFTSQPSPTTINSGLTATFSVVVTGTSPTYQWYQGASGDTANPIAGATAPSYSSTALTTTTSFWVRASNAAGNVDSSTVTATVITAPAITSQPSATTIAGGSTATFTVAASGTAPTFQWYQGTSGDTSNLISGATAASFTTSALTATTSFWVRAHNSAGDADSNAATATVITALAFTSQPSSTTISSGSTATFTVAVSGTAPTYQWYQGVSGDTSTPISGATAASYTTSAITATTSFWLRATNSAGHVDSNTVVATVVTVPLITEQPKAKWGAIEGDGVNISVGTTGIDLSYQWRKNGVDLTGKKQKTLVLTGLKLSDAGSYSVVVSNSAGSVTSTVSSLIVYSVSGDEDVDGLSNYDELINHGTDPSLSDSDGDGLSDTFERTFIGKANPTWLRVGDQVALDFKRLGRTGSIKLIGKLPNGLKFDSRVGILSGKIIGNSGLYSLSLQFADGNKITSIPFLLSVAAFPSPMTGSYAALLDNEDGYPVGMVSITVSAPGVWSGTLDLAGGSKIMSAKGSFSLDPCESEGRLGLEFPMQNHIDMVLDPASPLISGTHLEGAIRGFRLAKGRELPWKTSKLTVSIAQDVQDGFVAPAGLGWASGSISPSGAVLLTGQLGDAKAFQTSIKISATGQAILWLKPYRNTLSSLGGVFSLRDRGINLEYIDESLLEGLWWSREPDARELSYASGFGPISASLRVSTYAPAGNVTGFLKSLGLTKNIFETSIVGGGLPNLVAQAALPNAFKLDDGFNLLAIPNQGIPTIPWKGALKISDGSFGGALTLPGSGTDITVGSAQVSGVFLQNRTVGSAIGTGLVKIPVNGAKGSYRTAAVVIDGNN